GSDLKDVAPGEGETDNYTLDAYAQNIYYSSNKEDVERRHIWKSAVTGESTSQITKGAGIETDPIAVGANLYCFRTSLSSTSLLTRVDEFRKTNTPVNSFKPLPANYFVKPEAVAVPPSEGTSLGGQLFIDRLLNGKRIPLVFIHGGPQQQMMPGFHSNDTYSDVYAFNQYLASLGYAVIAINYRGSSGYGKDFRSSTKFDSKKELLDIVAAAKFLQLLPEVDKTKVGVFGLGYGGNLAEQMLANYSDLFKGGVNIQINDGSGSEDRVRAADIGKWSSPVLFIGSQDQLASKIELTTKLKNKNVSVDIFQLPSETPLNSRESRVIVFKNIQDFFDKKLK
ncbi:MAG TPA: hypothetical protein DGG95_13830, partial [Cytophagales bacterium]|nr:hypothetical protein [Cytophagales bacterium]